MQIGQKAIVTIDAIAGKTFPGRVTEIGNSPIQPATGQAAATAPRTATNFKVVVTLDAGAPEIRPGFTCTADISTASKTDVVAVPIQALTVRELEYDKAGAVVPKLRPPPPSRWSFGTAQAPAGPGGADRTPGWPHPQGGRRACSWSRTARRRSCRSRSASPASATSRWSKGLAQGDRVITGPFDSVRNLYEADDVREAPAPAAGS